MRRFAHLYSFLLVVCLPVVSLGQVAGSAPQKQAEVQGYSKTRMITPGTNLVIEGIPEIPMELAETVKKFTESVPVFGSNWHPIKREILVGKRAGNATQVHMLTSPLGTPKQLTDFPDPVGGGSWQPTEGKYFIFGKASGGNEVSQLHRYDADTGKITRLTMDDKKRIGGGPWSTAGDRLLYTAVATGAGSASETFKTELYTIDPANPESAKLLVAFDGVGWGASDWSPDDKKLLVGRFVSANESYLYLYDIATGEKTELTPKEGDEKISWAGAIFTKDGKGIYTATDKGSEFKRLIHMDLATRKITPLTSHIDWDVDGFTLSEDGKWLAFDTNENGFYKLHVLDTTTNKETKLPKLPSGQIGGYTWHKKTGELGLNITSYQSIADVYSLDLKSGKDHPLGKDRAEWLRHRRSPRARADQMEELRQPRDLRICLQAADGEVPGQTARRHQHPRRPRGPGDARSARTECILY